MVLIKSPVTIERSSTPMGWRAMNSVSSLVESKRRRKSARKNATANRNARGLLPGYRRGRRRHMNLDSADVDRIAFAFVLNLCGRRLYLIHRQKGNPGDGGSPRIAGL